MSGSELTTQRKRVLVAMKKAPPGGDYVWDGKDEEDRPLSREEMQKTSRLTAKNLDAYKPLT